VAADLVRTAGAGVVRQDGVDAATPTVKRRMAMRIARIIVFTRLLLPALACSGCSRGPCKNLGRNRPPYDRDPKRSNRIPSRTFVLRFPPVRSLNQRDFVFGPRRPRHTRNATTATAPPTSAKTTRNREPKGAADAERTWTDNVPIVDCPAPSKALTWTTCEPSV